MGGMSYSMVVTVRGGKAVVTMSGTVPDGTYEVAGHDDDDARGVSVIRRLPSGRYAEQATSVHHKVG